MKSAGILMPWLIGFRRSCEICSANWQCFLLIDGRRGSICKFADIFREVWTPRFQLSTSDRKNRYSLRSNYQRIKVASSRIKKREKTL